MAKISIDSVKIFQVEKKFHSRFGTRTFFENKINERSVDFEKQIFWLVKWNLRKKLIAVPEPKKIWRGIKIS